MRILRVGNGCKKALMVHSAYASLDALLQRRHSYGDRCSTGLAQARGAEARFPHRMVTFIGHNKQRPHLTAAVLGHGKQGRHFHVYSVHTGGLELSYLVRRFAVQGVSRPDRALTHGKFEALRLGV